MDEDSRRRRRDAEVNRDALLEAALGALGRDPAAGLDAVAAAAGLSRRTVYGHFASREELVAALADRAGEHLAAAVERVRLTTAPGEPPLTTLARLELAVWRSVERYRLLGGLAARPEHRERVVRHTDDVAALRLRLLQSARAGGDLARAVDAPVVARLLRAVPLNVFDAVLDGTLEAARAGRVAALVSLAVAGAEPAAAERHVEAALAADGDADADDRSRP